MRLIRYNEPKYSIFVGIFGSLARGAMQPLFGVILGKVLFILQGYNIEEGETVRG